MRLLAAYTSNSWACISGGHTLSMLLQLHVTRQVTALGIAQVVLHVLGAWCRCFGLHGKLLWLEVGAQGNAGKVASHDVSTALLDPSNRRKRSIRHFYIQLSIERLCAVSKQLDALLHTAANQARQPEVTNGDWFAGINPALINPLL